jgi:hypothetical protein
VLTCFLLLFVGWRWAPEDRCDPPTTVVRREARVVSVPFPQTDADVIANLEADLRARPGHYDSDIVDGVRAHSLRYDVLRIADWTGYDCDRTNPAFMIRVFDRRLGGEITRVAMLENGEIYDDQPRIIRTDRMRPIPTLAEAAEVLKRHHVTGTDAQYVFVSQATPHPFFEFYPYVAFHGGGGIYILADDGLFWLANNGEKISRQQAEAKLQTGLTAFAYGRDGLVIGYPVPAP